MRNSRKSMAVSAMVFLLLTAGIMSLASCGQSVYEAAADSTVSMNNDSADSVKSLSGRSAPAKEMKEPQSENTLIFVYICGAVAHPGVYELKGDARVVDAIYAAGGLNSDADLAYVNQARRLTDGEQVTVLTKEETEKLPSGQAAAAGDGTSQTGASAGQPAGTALVNINTAGKEELMTLKGIGESRAEDIISYRETNGSFSCIEDIMKVSGIKTSLFNKIKDQITV